jgi:large subunit ribosomal protein L10
MLINSMPKSRQEKQELIKGLEEKYDNSKSIVFIRFDALTVKENEALRQELKEKGGEYLVAKKTLLDIAFKDKDISGFEGAGNLEGRIATVFGYEDEVVPAKVVDKFKGATAGTIEFAGGVLDNKFLSGAEVESLAKVPDKQELYAKMVGSLNAPISGFANVLAGNLRNLVYVLKAVEEKRA